MSARPDWSDVAERAEMRRMRMEDREQEAFDKARVEVCTELRAKFVCAFNGEDVKFRSTNTNEWCDLKEIVSDALCSPNGAPMRALIEWQKPGCDEVFCRGSFREAVIDAYLDDMADDLAKKRMAVREREAMEP